DLVQDDPKARQSTIYSDQVQRLEKLRDEHELVEEIARFQRLGDLLAVILNPDREHDADVRTRLTRLKAWGTSTVYPLLLHLMDRRDRGTATSDQIAAAMLSVESFLVRRLLIGRATANINRTLLATTSEVKDEEDVAAAVHRYLSTGRSTSLPTRRSPRASRRTPSISTDGATSASSCCSGSRSPTRARNPSTPRSSPSSTSCRVPRPTPGARSWLPNSARRNPSRRSTRGSSTPS